MSMERYGFYTFSILFNSWFNIILFIRQFKVRDLRNLAENNEFFDSKFVKVRPKSEILSPSDRFNSNVDNSDFIHEDNQDAFKILLLASYGKCCILKASWLSSCIKSELSTLLLNLSEGDKISLFGLTFTNLIVVLIRSLLKVVKTKLTKKLIICLMLLKELKLTSHKMMNF
jgi:hypothetical protein